MDVTQYVIEQVVKAHPKWAWYGEAYTGTASHGQEASETVYDLQGQICAQPIMELNYNRSSTTTMVGEYVQLDIRSGLAKPAASEPDGWRLGFFSDEIDQLLTIITRLAQTGLPQVYHFRPQTKFEDSRPSLGDDVYELECTVDAQGRIEWRAWQGTWLPTYTRTYPTHHWVEGQPMNINESTPNEFPEDIRIEVNGKEVSALSFLDEKIKQSRVIEDAQEVRPTHKEQNVNE